MANENQKKPQNPNPQYLRFHSVSINGSISGSASAHCCMKPSMNPSPAERAGLMCFGSVLLFLFISQTITGIFLALYYVPSADRAHTTVAYIVKEVTGGSFLRSLHAYGSSAIVIVLLLHLTQTYLYGAYKGRRELLWISGCVLLALMLAWRSRGICCLGTKRLISPLPSGRIWRPMFLSLAHG